MDELFVRDQGRVLDRHDLLGLTVHYVDHRPFKEQAAVIMELPQTLDGQFTLMVMGDRFPVDATFDPHLTLQAGTFHLRGVKHGPLQHPFEVGAVQEAVQGGEGEAAPPRTLGERMRTFFRDWF